MTENNGKIKFIAPNTLEEVSETLNPLVKEWFFSKFKTFSLTQLYGVKNIRDRKNILVCAPTGGTKTLTAFLAIINYLASLALKNELEDKIYAVYVSPLKALSGDVFVNLVQPLKEIGELATKKSLKMQEIKVSLRTGDTTSSERQKMLKHSPHILVCTPETLAIVLTSPKLVEHLHAVEFVVVDEIHAMANKRGVYLTLTLERLCAVSLIEPVRIGLSATIAPLEEIAKLLVGVGRDCLIAQVKLLKKIEIELDFPGEDIIEAENIENQRKLYHILDEMISKHKTTLIFTNTRAATERIVHYLDLHFPGKYVGLIGAHHSSMSKEKRFEIEDKLRKGELKVVVSSTSLELGIDIGDIDLVVMLRSPKSVSRALQRCLTYDSLVLCVDGTYKKIGEIVSKKLDVDVISYAENKGFVKNKIKSWLENGVGEPLDIKLKCGEEIRCTPEHPILTKEGWKEAKELKIGDLIAEIRNKIDFASTEPYLFELLPLNKIFVVNEDNFFQKIVDEYRQKNKLNVGEFAEKFGMPYFRLVDCRRINGRKKSVRLDYFLKACELCAVPKKTYLTYLSNLKTKGTKWPKWPLKLTKEIMWLAGIVATDGCIVKSQRKGEAEYYKIKIGNKSKIMIDKLGEIVKKFEISPYIAFKDGIYQFEFGSNLLAHLFMALGIPCKNKSFEIDVGEKIFALPDELIYAYLEGILEGDGNVNFEKGKSSGMMRIFSASKNFALGMHKLFSRMGYGNKVSKGKIKASKLIEKVSNKDLYCVGLYRKEDLRRFFDKCLCYGERAQKGREATKDFLPYMSTKLEFNRFIDYSEIESIEKCENEKIYNLTLENEPNNFIVSNVIVHNCGRAGHRLHENPHGQFIVLDRDDLVECGVLMKEMIEGSVDLAEIPRNCLDVLSQQIFGMAITKVWNAGEMLKTIRRAYPYENLTKEDFLSVVSYLAGDYALEHRYVYAKIWYDAAKNEIGKRGKLARVIYMTNLGTIPSEEGVTVAVGAGERRGSIVGRIDESFLEKMKRGDIFVLGGQKYQFLYSRGMKAFVMAGITKNPTIPSWFSEMLPLNFELALGIGRFRRLVKEKLDDKEKCVSFIQDFVYCKKYIAEEIYSYLKQQQEFAEVPDDKLIVVEKFKEEKEYLLFHSLYGRRVNDALARAFAFAAARLKHRDVEIGVNDNGFFIAGESLDEKKIVSWVLEKSDELRAILKEAIEKTEVLRRRFRHCAARSLMILRNYKGREKSVGRQQVHSELLFVAVKKLSDDFPILREARREVMEDLMNVDDAEKVLSWIKSDKVKIKHIRTPLVSPFGLNLILQGRSDLIKIEDRASFLKRMHELHQKVIASRNIDEG